MKKASAFLLAVSTVFALATPAAAAYGAAQDVSRLRGGFMSLLVICAIMAILCVGMTVNKIIAHRRKKAEISGIVLAVLYFTTLMILAATLFGYRIWQRADVPADVHNPGTEQTVSPTEHPTEPSPTETEPPQTEAPTEPPVLFQPAMTDVSNPENWNMTWEIIENETIVESYQRADPISFGEGSDYFALPGVSTFRGNNYRNSATYGTAVVKEEKLTRVWSHSVGALDGWGGCAWTGQPLVVQWDAETRAIMNLYESKKNKEDLVEVIYATLDGKVHFYDLEDGTPTRDVINIGMNFKGAGALDPRGYPLLYVGAGLYTYDTTPRMFVVSLITGEILYRHGHEETFEFRQDWTAFDSSPLVHAETDTLIWPSENGILYTIKLNTQYDKAAGTISVAPDAPVKTRYTSDYYKKDRRYLGYESSASIVGNYLYVSENGGLFHCVDLNTMELVWAQDTKDDSNSSPVFEWGEDGNGYIYTAPSLHWTAGKWANQVGHGSVSIYKLNAQTGEIVWELSRDCVTVKDVSGGVQATPLLGKEGSNIEDLIIYIVARIPKAYDGTMIAINRETGEVVWETSTFNYAWSSPVAFYTEEGKAYLAYINASGRIRLLDAETGEILDDIIFDTTTEASPVVFEDMLVFGTRGGVHGIKIS